MKFLTLLLVGAVACAHAQVRICYDGGIRRGDTLKGNVKRMTEIIGEGPWLKKTIYTYDKTKQVQTAEFYGEADTLYAKWLAQYDSQGRIMEKTLSLSGYPPCEQTTYKYDKLGRNVEEYDSSGSYCYGLYDWLQGSISEWVTGIDYSISIKHNEYDAANRLATIKGQSMQGGPRYIAKNTWTTSNKYYSNGKLAQTVTISCNIRRENKDSNLPTSTDITVESASYKYDSKGNKSEEIRIEKNKYGQKKTDTTITYYSYDAHNRRIDERSYGKMETRINKPELGRPIGAGFEYNYDSVGKMTTNTFYYVYRRANGSEVKDVDQVYKVPEQVQEEREYDKQGNVVKIRYGTTTTLTRQIEYY